MAGKTTFLCPIGWASSTNILPESPFPHQVGVVPPYPDLVHAPQHPGLDHLQYVEVEDGGELRVLLQGDSQISGEVVLEVREGGQVGRLLQGSQLGVEEDQQLPLPRLHDLVDASGIEEALLGHHVVVQPPLGRALRTATRPCGEDVLSAGHQLVPTLQDVLSLEDANSSDGLAQANSNVVEEATQ